MSRRLKGFTVNNTVLRLVQFKHFQIHKIKKIKCYYTKNKLRTH